ncbi:MAG: AmmeMemoRadiSam system protein A [Bacillota bacterium]
MGKLVFAGIAPHPPIIVEAVGRGQNQESAKTIAAMQAWAKELKKSEPEVLVIITPHGNLFQDAIAVHAYAELKGSFASFGVSGTGYSFANHKELRETIVKTASQKGFQVMEVNETSRSRYRLQKDLDHGVLVPLDFLVREGVEIPLVVISMALLDYIDLYRFGTVLGEVIEKGKWKVALVASADLSHRLTRNAPAGFDPMGKEFDDKLVDLVRQGKLSELLDLDEELVERAGECGLRPIIMLAGALDSHEIDPRVLSYEGPYGVGYLVAFFEVNKTGGSRIEEWRNSKKVEAAGRRLDESIPVQLARKSLQYYLEKGKYLPIPSSLEEMLKEQKACFVSLKKNGRLRGCIGTIEPVRSMLAEEIICNSVSAGTGDPRFSPVTADELDELVFSVDVLSKPEPVDSIEALDPKVYGIIVKRGSRSGVLLPNLEGVDTVEYQLEITLSKAGISPHEDYKIYRFRVDRYY